MVGVGLVRWRVVWFRGVWFDLVRFGLVWFGVVGLARFGSVWFGLVRFGSVWFTFSLSARKTADFGSGLLFLQSEYDTFHGL